MERTWPRLSHTRGEGRRRSMMTMLPSSIPIEYEYCDSGLNLNYRHCVLFGGEGEGENMKFCVSM